MVSQTIKTITVNQTPATFTVNDDGTVTILTPKMEPNTEYHIQVTCENTADNRPPVEYVISDMKKREALYTLLPRGPLPKKQSNHPRSPRESYRRQRYG